MKRQKLKSKNKIKGILYKNQYIEKNSAYAYGTGKYKTVLFYAFQGPEIYFKNISDAKKYVDQNHFNYLNDLREESKRLEKLIKEEGQRPEKLTKEELLNLDIPF